MKKLIAAFILFAGLSGTALAASSNFLGTLPTTGNTAGFAAWCVGGTGANCTGGVFWPSTVIANSAGTELFTSGNPGLVDESTSSQFHTDLSAPPNLSVNGTGTGWTGLTPGTAQTGTIIAANSDLTSVGGVAIGAMANYGTSPGAVKVQGVNASITAIAAGATIIGKFGIDQTTPGTTNGISIVGVNGATALGGTGAVGAGTLRIAVGTDPATVAGTAPVKTSVPIIDGANTYNTIAASQSAQALTGGSGGATGDYLSHCTVIPTTVSPGVVTILDNSTTIYGFPGGSSSLSNLVPFSIPIGALSTSGAWKITTGAGLSVVCVGKFT